MKSTIFYRGPSMIDGAPIMGIASGLSGSSDNIKTGRMIQTWILRADISPLEASRQGKDVSICGSCKMRHNLGGACYVQLFQAPQSIFHAAAAGRYLEYPALKPAQLRRFNLAFKKLPVRLGAYGDPAAIPEKGWLPIMTRAKRNTGYTHQWMNSAAQWLRPWCMASVETIEEKELAASLGWRTFRTGADEKPGRDEIRCLNQLEEYIQCDECMVCNGQQKNVYGLVHGTRKRRFLEAA
jgi:hypothetical protein